MPSASGLLAPAPRAFLPLVGVFVATVLALAPVALNAAARAAVKTADSGDDLDTQLQAALAAAGFTGGIQDTLQARMGRPINQQLSELGRVLFFDPVQGLHNDNACAGCHSPATGFAGTDSISIGTQNNMIVGPARTGPRNHRRSPTIVNSPFYPNLMWDMRFSAISGNPFDNSRGFLFPLPEGTTKFGPNDPIVTALVIAQAHMPLTELIESAGFTGTRNTISKQFNQFDDGLGDIVPMPDASGFRNEPILSAVAARLNAVANYRRQFGAIFPEVAAGAPITALMFAQAIGEWEFSMVRANAPLDRYARGRLTALTDGEKRGAIVFFGDGNCTACHSVSGNSNEMFSDFKGHNIGVPQIAPVFGSGHGNVIFDGANQNEDYGLEEFTGNPADRYMFRSAPLRNISLQPAFFHNGAFLSIDAAVRHHLDAANSARNYSAATAGLAGDLRRSLASPEPMLATLDPLMVTPPVLTEPEINHLVEFLGKGLLDPLASQYLFCRKIPGKLPSRMTAMTFQGCPQGTSDAGTASAQSARDSTTHDKR